MKQVTYERNGDRYNLSTANVVLIFDGKPWDHTGWSVDPVTFERLRIENPDVDFVERTSR